MPTKHRTLPDHVVTTALQAHARAQCAHEDHDMVRVTTCMCGHEERERVPRHAPDADVEHIYAGFVAARAMELRVREYLASDLEPDAKVFGIVLMYEIEDARRLGYRGLTVTNTDGTVYECTLDPFNVAIRQQGGSQRAL